MKAKITLLWVGGEFTGVYGTGGAAFAAYITGHGPRLHLPYKMETRDVDFIELENLVDGAVSQTVWSALVAGRHDQSVIGE